MPKHNPTMMRRNLLPGESETYRQYDCKHYDGCLDTAIEFSFSGGLNAKAFHCLECAGYEKAAAKAIGHTIPMKSIWDDILWESPCEDGDGPSADCG